MGVRMEGLAVWNRAIESAVKGIRADSVDLTTRVAQGVALYTAPYIPVETSALINSEYITNAIRGGKVVAVLGYSAHYAPNVYEKSGSLRGKPRSGKRRGRYWDAIGGESTAQPGWFDHGVPDYLREGLASTLAEFQKK